METGPVRQEAYPVPAPAGLRGVGGGTGEEETSREIIGRYRARPVIASQPAGGGRVPWGSGGRALTGTGRGG
jgi:hypothetical protein